MAKVGFRGMPGGMNQAAMMKQAQKMQQEMLRMQEEMENKTYSATSCSTSGLSTISFASWFAQMSISVSPRSSPLIGAWALVVKKPA